MVSSLALHKIRCSCEPAFTPSNVPDRKYGTLVASFSQTLWAAAERDRRFTNAKQFILLSFGATSSADEVDGRRNSGTAPSVGPIFYVAQIPKTVTRTELRRKIVHLKLDPVWPEHNFIIRILCYGNHFFVFHTPALFLPRVSKIQPIPSSLVR